MPLSAAALLAAAVSAPVGPVARKPSTPWFYFDAKARNSCEICIEQNLAPHIEQKCAVLAPSVGSVWPWYRSAVSESKLWRSDRASGFEKRSAAYVLPDRTIGVRSGEVSVWIVPILWKPKRS
jgi:hypothetical protein